MSFSDLLKKPLPSKAAQEDVATESTEIEASVETEGAETDIAPEMEKELQKMTTEDSDNDDDREDDVDDEDDDDEDEAEDDLKGINLDDLTDEELEEMETALRDSDLDDVIGDVEPVELTAEEEREADDLMSLAGTTELLREELNVEERTAFLESSRETQIAVFEGFLLESDVQVQSTDDVVTEAKMWNKTTIRLSREDRKAQLYAVAVNVSARAHNDPDYIKLLKVQKMRRILKRKLQKKYHGEAMRRMKVYFNRLKASKSPILSALGKKIDDGKAD